MRYGQTCAATGLVAVDPDFGSPEDAFEKQLDVFAGEGCGNGYLARIPGAADIRMLAGKMEKYLAVQMVRG